MRNEAQSVLRKQAAAGRIGILEQAGRRYCKLPAGAGMTATGVIPAPLPGPCNGGLMQVPRRRGDGGPVVKPGGRR